MSFSEDIDKFGLIAAAHIQTVENGGHFWTDIYKSTLIKSIELNYKDEIIRTYGICDIVIVPERGNKSQQVLIQWYRRHQPLTDKEIADMRGESAAERLIKLTEACRRLLDSPHPDHFAARLGEDEMSALEEIKAIIDGKC